MNNKVEYKKINYIMSIDNCTKENLNKININNTGLKYIKDFINNYDKLIKPKMFNSTLSLEDKKNILENIIKDIPKDLIVIRSHIKNCLYSNTMNDFKYKYEKYLDKDINRLRLLF